MSFRTYLIAFFILTLILIGITIVDWRVNDVINLGEFGLPKPVAVFGFVSIMWVGSFALKFMPKLDEKHKSSGPFLMWCVLLTMAYILLDKSLLFAFNSGWVGSPTLERADMAYYGFFIMLLANFQTKTLPPAGKTPEETHLRDVRFRASSKATFLFGLAFVVIWLLVPSKTIALGSSISAFAIMCLYILWRCSKVKRQLV
ncbi:hypothetical protein [Hirschia maritima]|uniref:hypothetical protein n=1 Tax=Hirschia maritima TaxID=1121961 RepID=UPI000372D9A1|nr:hypothetical protein [Hirschia maritima]